MGTTSEKLTYLNGTKTLLKDVINYSGAGITSETTFRNYAVKLYDAYIDILKGEYSLIEGMPKGQVEGISAVINNAEDLPVYELKMTKESTQDGEPTPDNPVPVNVVEGYRNLFDKDNATTKLRYIKNDSGVEISSNVSGYLTSYVAVNPNVEYTLHGKLVDEGSVVRIYYYNENKEWISRSEAYGVGVNVCTFTTPNNCYYIQFQFRIGILDLDIIQLVEGDQELPYVPYGNNYIAVNVSDGTNTNNYPLPLNGNEIVGIGDYKDELKVDKTGHVYLNKKTGKIILDGTTNAFNLKSSSIRNTVYLTPEINNMKSAKVNTEIVPAFCSHFINDSSSVVANLNIIAMGIRVDERINFGFGLSSNLTTLEQANQWLTTQYNNGTPVTTYYPLETPELIDLQTTVDIELFKGVNNISNSEDGLMNVEYVKEYEEA